MDLLNTQKHLFYWLPLKCPMFVITSSLVWIFLNIIVKKWFVASVRMGIMQWVQFHSFHWMSLRMCILIAHISRTLVHIPLSVSNNNLQWVQIPVNCWLFSTQRVVQQRLQILGCWFWCFIMLHLVFVWWCFSNKHSKTWLPNV